MAQAKMKLRTAVTFAWWFDFYFWGIVACVFITGLAPDMDKFKAVAIRAMRIRVVGCDEADD